MKIYYQGIPGAYSHQVAKIVGSFLKEKGLEDTVKILGVFSFNDIFSNLEKDGGIGIIPIENSYAGSVHQNLYLMRDYKVRILAEYFLPVNHCLASLSNTLEDLKEVYSHPQALMQCESFIKKYKLKPISFSDTAGSAKYVADKKDKTLGAICSEHAAKLYGLNILAKNINDQIDNTTRFLVISKEDKAIKLKSYFRFKESKQTLIFRVKDQPAILFKCLGAFATRGINLTKIESIPSKRGNFEYLFRIDFEINGVSDEFLNDALEELRFFTREIINLGKYGKLIV